MPTDTETFFKVSREQSEVKATIVESYFDTWAKIMSATQNLHAARLGVKSELLYIDLFAGPGRYEDNTISTPLRILQKAITGDYAERLHTVFNDLDTNSTQTLSEEINRLPGIEKLKHPPVVWNEEVGDQIAAQFGSIEKTIPILAFIDPWGYKGLSLRLVESFVKSWGCDCIFFFNYMRINAGLGNSKVKEHMEALFGAKRAAELKEQLEPKEPAEREAIIVEALAQALKEQAQGNRFVLPFCFKNNKGVRTSHHLILVTKHFKGYEVMKDIMYKASSSHDQGVASFMYSPPASNAQQLLFSLNRPLDQLRGRLLEDMAGKKLTMRQIYEQHSIDTPYVSKNYKEILKAMEDSNAIQTYGRKSKKGFADDLLVTFPPRKGG